MKPYYDHGGITIYHGDCRDVLPLLDEAPQLMLTDPPYGIGFAAQPTKWQRRAGARPESWDTDAAEALSFALPYAQTVVVWGGNYFDLPRTRGWLVWIKPDAPPSMGSVELAWTSVDQNARHIVVSISDTNKERVGHPTQKPLKVMRWAASQVGCSGLVIDPFMGSGTTMVVARERGRRAIGIEIEERYCEIAAKRLGQEMLFAAVEG